MTQDEFFITYDKLIRGLIYKNCKSEDMRDDVYSEVVMSLLNAGKVFDLPKPAQIAYIEKAVKTTSYCNKKSLKKSRTYGDLQSDDNDTDPEEYAIPDDTYSPETEHQDLLLRDKVLDIADQWKATKKLIRILQKNSGTKIGDLAKHGVALLYGFSVANIMSDYKRNCLWKTKERITKLTKIKEKKK